MPCKCDIGNLFMKNWKILLRGTAHNMRGGGGAGVRVRARVRVGAGVCVRTCVRTCARVRAACLVRLWPTTCAQACLQTSP